ncbi:MAG: HdeD family acid-resistance protein [Terriglobia bacterium]
MTTHSLTEEIKTRSAWSIFMGVVTAALGVFLIVYPLAAAAMTTVLLGWALIFVGIAHFVFALNSQTAGNFFLKVFLSVLYGISGIALAFFPIVGVAALTGVLGTLLLIQAGLLTVTAFQLKPLDGWGWLLVDAGASLLLGIMIIAQWPFSSVWAIGTLVGVSVLMGGISRIMISAKLRSGAASVQRFVQGAA